MLHPYWQVISHVDLKVFKRINLQSLENASMRYAPDQKVWAPNFLSYFSFFHQFVRESPETLSHQPAQIGCPSSWPQQSVSLCELMWVFFSAESCIKMGNYKALKFTLNWQKYWFNPRQLTFWQHVSLSADNIRHFRFSLYFLTVIGDSNEACGVVILPILGHIPAV